MRELYCARGQIALISLRSLRPCGQFMNRQDAKIAKNTKEHFRVVYSIGEKYETIFASFRHFRTVRIKTTLLHKFRDHPFRKGSTGLLQGIFGGNGLR